MTKIQNSIAKLLGKKREVIERVLNEDEEEYKSLPEQESLHSIEEIMKEIETETILDRQEVIESCIELLMKEPKLLLKDSHLNYLYFAFTTQFPPNLIALDASQPWMLYWIANSLKVLSRESLSEDFQRRVARKLLEISPEGGPFGGGIGQIPHIAGTYAAINALSLCNNIEGCWDKINRKAIYEWLLKLKQADGGFKTYLEVGESDTRGVYCALSVASMLNVLTPQLCDGVLEYLINCQTYEGGFGATPQVDEAHGGYTFCAVASLMILKQLDKINVEALIQWCSSQQCFEERGLNGRSNKLVDGCYSFWIGGTAAMIEAAGYGCCIDQNALHEYICQCCQNEQGGGLIDKPGKSPDFYHTNYVLLGLSISESEYSLQEDNITNNISTILIRSKQNNSLSYPLSNLNSINPVYGIPNTDLLNFVKHFNTPL